MTSLKWFLIAAGVGVVYFVYRYPYAVGALVKHPSELNEAAKQLNAVANVASSVSDLYSTAASDWAALKAQF